MKDVQLADVRIEESMPARDLWERRLLRDGKSSSEEAKRTKRAKGREGGRRARRGL